MTIKNYMPAMWMGKPIAEISREGLLEIIASLFRELEEERLEHTRQLDILT